MPEVVDKTTYVIKIRPNVFFHDTERIRKQFPQVAGRQLTAEDVRYSIDRQRNKESPKSALFYRGYQWESVDTIEMRTGRRASPLRITTKGPVAPFKHYLADTYATIIPKELVDPAKDEMNASDKMVGSGPFILDKFTALQLARCVRNPNWFAKDDLADQGLPDRPIVDGYEALWRPADQLSTEAAFRRKQVDGRVPDKASVEPVTGRGYVDRKWRAAVSSRLLIKDSPAGSDSVQGPAPAPGHQHRGRPQPDRADVLPGRLQLRFSCGPGCPQVGASPGRTDPAAGLSLQARRSGGGPGGRQAMWEAGGERPSGRWSACTRVSRTSCSNAPRVPEDAGRQSGPGG